MIPNFLSKKPIPDVLPESMEPVLEHLRSSPSKEECLKRAYSIITSKYRGYKIRTYLRFWEMFNHDISYWWGRSGLLGCTNFNFMLRTLLVRSGMFRDEDIIPRITVLYISPHQYLDVKLDSGKSIKVDCWAKAYGIALGDYAHGFNC